MLKVPFCACPLGSRTTVDITAAEVFLRTVGTADPAPPKLDVSEKLQVNAQQTNRLCDFDDLSPSGYRFLRSYLCRTRRTNVRTKGNQSQAIDNSRVLVPPFRDIGPGFIAPLRLMRVWFGFLTLGNLLRFGAGL